jgi:peptide/nickel transport system permease protein
VVLYILRRVLSAISVIFVTLLASFLLFFVAPTDPAGTICGPRCPNQKYEDIRRSLNLDRPVLVQFGEYMRGLVAGRDIHTGPIVTHCAAPCLGYSFTLNQPVTQLLARAVPVTVSIVLGGAVIYFGVGVMTGTVAARKRGAFVDRAVIGTALTVNSVPYFIVALLVALYATFLPPSQWTPLWQNPLAWASGLLAAWLVLGLTNAASYTRYSRNSMIESLSEDYTRTARSKGISERRVVYRHGLRAALAPVVTILGLDIAFQITNTVFTESIFGLPGIGLLTLRAFTNFDLPVLMGSVLVGAIVLVTLNLLVDLLYTVLDPRVRLG